MSARTAEATGLLQAGCHREVLLGQRWEGCARVCENALALERKVELGISIKLLVCVCVCVCGERPYLKLVQQGVVIVCWIVDCM